MVYREYCTWSDNLTKLYTSRGYKFCTVVYSKLVNVVSLHASRTFETGI